MALAPSRDLFGVPSRSQRVRSIAPCSVGAGADERLGDLVVDVARRPWSRPCRSRRRRRREARSPRTRRSRPPRGPRRGPARRCRGDVDLDRRDCPASRGSGARGWIRSLAMGTREVSRRASPRRWKRSAAARRASSGSIRAPGVVDQREQAPRPSPRSAASRASTAQPLARPPSSVAEPGRGGPALDLARVEQAGKVLGDVGERLASELRPSTSRLIRSQLAQDLARRS